MPTPMAERPIQMRKSITGIEANLNAHNRVFSAWRGNDLVVLIYQADRPIQRIIVDADMVPILETSLRRQQARRGFAQQNDPNTLTAT